MIEGKIVKIISNLMTVEAGGTRYDCKPRGKFYHQKLTPLVGDKVVIDKENKYILEIKERRNYLTRPSIANVDACIITTSLKEPDLSLLLLDKILCLIIYNNIMPIICFTKFDLLSDEEKQKVMVIYDYYNKIGIRTVFNDEIDKLDKLIANKTIVLTGQTGAGKSSLLNRLDPSLNLATNEISKALGRGVHTTRCVELFKYKTSLIADTPGFSSLDLKDLTKENIRDAFVEFNYNCEFRDCYHQNEKNCEVKRRVQEGDILQSRYDNYLKLGREYESSRIFYKK
jgi:ribosome biogenesis GTPase